MNAVRTAAALAILLAPGLAHAHHILGLPHYKYGEDYPQIPYVEIMAQVDQYDLHFTYFPGTPVPGERVRFKLYVYDRTTKEPFREPLDIAIYRERSIRGDVPLTDRYQIRTGVGPEANDYKFFYTFDAADAYRIRLYFPSRGGVEMIPFPVQIGVTDTRPLLGGAVGVLFLSVASVAVIKRRRRPRDRRDGGRRSEP